MEGRMEMIKKRLKMVFVVSIASIIYLSGKG